MNIKILSKQVIAVLKLPAAISEFIQFVKAIIKAMAGNATFEALTDKVSALNAKLSALERAETACRTKPPTGTTTTRDLALEQVKADLLNLRYEVQLIANNDAENAVEIIESAGMWVKKTNVHQKQKNTAENGILEGSVDLTAEGNGPHEWRMSTDEIQWITLDATLNSKTTITNLNLGVVYYFRNRRIKGADEPNEWSQSVKIRIK